MSHKGGMLVETGQFCLLIIEVA